MWKRWTESARLYWRKIWAPAKVVFRSRQDNVQRWERIEAVFNQACTLEGKEREQFLDSVRGKSESEYREVVALLPYSQEELSCIPLRPDDPEGDSPRLQEKDILGNYEIIRLVGRGAVGEVYLAQDPELPRHVALKVLSKRVAGDPELIERFKREARAASALNHPYILTIHDFKQLGTLHYIVTEYVEGKPLRDYIGTLSLEQAVEYARQVGEALITAHAAGIVHRDIKPENIMVHPNGYVKVLDFGLAKPGDLEPSIQGRRLAELVAVGFHTDAGVLMGTLNYMSPEHLNGEGVGPQSDVWSWGVMLYEMLSGRRPFEKPTQEEVVNAILHWEPPPPTSNKELNRLIEKALSKKLATRYKSMAAALDDLNRIEAALGAERASSPKRISSAVWKWMNSRRREILVVSLLLMLGPALYLIREIFPGRQFRVTEITQLTHAGNIRRVALSDDEHAIAYTTQDIDGQKLWVRQFGPEHQDKQVHSSAGSYTGVTFARDGKSIYYVLRQNEVGKLYRLPLEGGLPKMVLDNVDSAISFSPDGAQFAFLRIDSNTRRAWLVSKGLEVSPESTPVTLTAPDYFWTAPIWSHDGCCLLFGVLNDSGTGVTNIRIMSVNLKNGRQEVIGPEPWYRMGRPIWSRNGRALMVPATANNSDRAQLLEVSWPGGKISPLIRTGNSYRDLDSGQEQENVATVQEIRRSQPWLITLADGKRHAIPNLSGTFYGIAWTSSGQIISQSDVDGNPDLWLIDPQTGIRRAITRDASVEEDPAASPAGGYFTFASNRDGAFHLWRSTYDGGEPQRLTADTSIEEEDTFTPDGSEVLYTSIREGFPALWKVSIRGGTPLQVTKHSARKASVSPDGRFIVCDYVEDPQRGWVTAVLNAKDGKPVRVFAEIPAGDSALPVRWSADGSKLLYVLTTVGASNIWEYPFFNGDVPRQLTHFGGERIFAFAASPDGRSLACILGTLTSDVAMVHVAKEQSLISFYGVKLMNTLNELEILLALALALAIFFLLLYYKKRHKRDTNRSGGDNDGAGTVQPTGNTGPNG